MYKTYYQLENYIHSKVIKDWNDPKIVETLEEKIGGIIEEEKYTEIPDDCILFQNEDLDIHGNITLVVTQENSEDFEATDKVKSKNDIDNGLKISQHINNDLTPLLFQKNNKASAFQGISINKEYDFLLFHWRKMT